MYKMKKENFTILVVIAFIFLSLNANAQIKNIDTVDVMYHVPSIASKINELVPSVEMFREPNDKRVIAAQVIPGKDQQIENDFFVRNRHPMEQSRAAGPPLLVFDAVTQNSQPNDPSLAIGPDHVFVVYNLGFRIFDKAGNPLTDQLDDSNIFTNGSGCCDPTISYDNAADRWVMSILFDDLWGSTFDGIQIAISDGPNPVTSGWNVYQYNIDTHAPKISVWSDGYYMTSNSEEPEKIHVLEREEMLTGGPSPQIIGFELPGAVIKAFPKK